MTIEETAPRVDFVVAGTQKGGTTALRHFLSQHPGIGMPRPDIREPHFFDRRILHLRGRGLHKSYHALYAPQDLEKVTGDVTPFYMFDPDTLARIKQYNPAMKVIMILRNPAERAYSQWNMERERGNEHRGFATALLHEIAHLRRYKRHPVHSYLQRGFYSPQVAQAFDSFGKDRCLVLKTEDLLLRHEETLVKIYRFLGVGAAPLPPPKKVHGRDYAPMPKALLLLLRAIYHRDVRQLERSLGWSVPSWRLL